MIKVPFFSNTKDDLHCYQAALKMVLKYFLPKRNFSRKQLELLTSFQKGLWTWPMRGVLSMIDLGFTVRDIEQFDYAAVGKDAKEYLQIIYGHEAAREQITHSDIVKEERTAIEFTKRVKPEFRIPNKEDLAMLLDEGYLVLCLVNSKILNRKQGYIGHIVVVFGVTSSSVVLHDPGLPPRSNRRVSWKVFERSWAYPDKKAKNILAFRL